MSTLDTRVIVTVRGMRTQEQMRALERDFLVPHADYGTSLSTYSYDAATIRAEFYVHAYKGEDVPTHPVELAAWAAIKLVGHPGLVDVTHIQISVET